MKAKDPRSGVALILVMVSVAFMAIIIVEIIAASRVDLRIAINARNRLQAQYMALSGAKLQLLRLHMYREVRNAAGVNNLSITPEMMDKIWNVPMPEFPFPGVKTTWPGKMMGTISTEGSKLPINLLDGAKHRGSSKEIADSVREQIKILITGLLETEEFDEKYRGLEPDDLIDPLQDWIDTNKDRVKGGDEDREYERLDPPYTSRNDRMPSISELHLVQGWTDDLIRRLAPSFSVLNSAMKVNPNYISETTLQAWGPELTKAELARIDQHRRLTPFGSMTDLQNFVRSDPEIRGGEKFVIPELFLKAENQTTREQIFVIQASGVIANVRRNFRLGVVLHEEKPAKRPPGTPPPAPEDKKPGKLMEPQVVFVEEYL